MTNPVKLGTQAMGAAAGELLQYQLLKQGIDSARLPTDSGISRLQARWRQGAPKSLKVNDMARHRLEPFIANLLGGERRELP